MFSIGLPLIDWVLGKRESLCVYQLDVRGTPVFSMVSRKSVANRGCAWPRSCRGAGDPEATAECYSPVTRYGFSYHDLFALTYFIITKMPCSVTPSKSLIGKRIDIHTDNWIESETNRNILFVWLQILSLRGEGFKTYSGSRFINFSRGLINPEHGVYQILPSLVCNTPK